MDSESQRMVSARPLKVLILTAAVAGGHEAAGHALQAELETAGHHAQVSDGIKPMGGMMEWLLYPGYQHLLKYCPSAYGLFFSIAASRPGAAWTRFLVGRTCADRLLTAVEQEEPDVVVSTYPFVTAALGHLRQGGKLAVPVIALIDDYGVHRLWVASGADLHLVASSSSAELATRAGGRARVASLPVAPAFRDAPTRDAARATFGLPAAANIALVVGGAWGVGDVAGAVACATEAGWYAVVVTGTNAALRKRLERRYPDRTRVCVLGWTQEMPQLMAAADCLIQNAGGMTCLEAVTQGLPILLYKPIPGHGELNAGVMEQAGAARRVGNRAELRDVLQAAATGEIQLAPPRRERGCSATTAITELVASAVPPVPRRQPSLRRRLAPVVLGVPLFWLALSARGHRQRGRTAADTGNQPARHWRPRRSRR